MNLLDITLYFAAEMSCGAVNSVAGGGTFLTFPILIMGGLSPLSANIMSTIALWPGSVSSAYTYRKQLPGDREWLFAFAAVSMLGGAIGTIVLLVSPEVVFERLVPWLLLFATLVFTFGGRGISWCRQFGAAHGANRSLGLALQFAIALYGGYFGAGLGILMLAMLQVMGLSHIHQMNALKTLLGSVINASAVVIFAMSGKVIWEVAAVMVAGAVIGGHLGARLALRVSPDTVRRAVIVIGFLMTAYFFAHEA
ncbi:MAG: sulfite exporter TauE/SafE family protein [Opitutaceae bacterium]|nr:sulfite exporter TauE/SafE family protein [Opitutaceae bacterium]